MEALLDIKDLVIEYKTDDAVIKAVNGISIKVAKGECVAIVGETGAGKTTTALGIMNLLPDPQGKYINGEIFYEGNDIIRQTPTVMRKIRGKKISMIFQDPMTSLNPIITVGEQIMEVIRLHEGLSFSEATIKAQDMLQLVGIPADRYKEYPHQFSGGMKQRVIIAIALACNPQLLIADEPTTALDVTIQAQVLDMMKNLINKLNTSMLLITHDLGVVAEMCNKVAIMYCGEIVEFGSTRAVFKQPTHPYTIGLFDSLPNLKSTVNRLKPIPGMIPDPADLPKGCKFANRCSKCMDKCLNEEPASIDLGEGHIAKCHFAKEAE